MKLPEIIVRLQSDVAKLSLREMTMPGQDQIPRARELYEAVKLAKLRLEQSGLILGDEAQS